MDPDPGGPKTCGSGGSESATLAKISYILEKNTVSKNLGGKLWAFDDIIFPTFKKNTDQADKIILILDRKN
jgi:hypothetical protein